MPIDKQIEIENERQHTTIKCAPRVWCMYRHRHQCRQPISINTWLRLAQDNYLNHFHRARWTLEHVFYPQNSNQKKNATKRKSNLISIHNQNTNTHTRTENKPNTIPQKHKHTERNNTTHYHRMFPSNAHVPAPNCVYLISFFPFILSVLSMFRFFGVDFTFSVCWFSGQLKILAIFG